VLRLVRVSKAWYKDVAAFLRVKLSRTGVQLFCLQGGRPLRQSPVSSDAERQAWLQCYQDISPQRRNSINPLSKRPPGQRRGAMDAGDTRRLPTLCLQAVNEVHLDLREPRYLTDPLDLSSSLFPNLECLTIHWPEVISAVPIQPPFSIITWLRWWTSRYPEIDPAWLHDVLLSPMNKFRVLFKQTYTVVQDRTRPEVFRRKDYLLEAPVPRARRSELKLIEERESGGNALASTR
jgi:hypothetical protein